MSTDPKATARLIAAAPNLLEALETVLDEVVFLEHAPSCASGVGAQGYDPANCNGCSLHQARAAIAQARGENL